MTMLTRGSPRSRRRGPAGGRRRGFFWNSHFDDSIEYCSSGTRCWFASCSAVFYFQVSIAA
jgi:hypothetical protein